MLLKMDSSNKKFDKLHAAWAAECVKFGDDIADYSPAYLEHARKICSEVPPDANYGVYALKLKKEYTGLVHINAARLPKTTGKTLRLLWLLLKPAYDYEDVSPSDLATISTSLIMSSLDLAKTKSCEQIKIHLGNDIDRRFFVAVASVFNAQKIFKDSSVRGNWLHIEM